MAPPAPKRGKPCPFAFDAAEFEEGKHPRAENGQFGSGGGSSGATTYKSGGASTKEPAGEHVDTDEDIAATSHDGKEVTYDLAYHHDGDTVRGHVHNVRDAEGHDAFEGLDRVQSYKLGKALSSHAESHVAGHAAEATEESRQEYLTPEQHEAEVTAHEAATAKAEAAKTSTIGGAVETLLARGWTPSQGKFHQQPELKGFASPSSQRQIKDLLRAKGHAVDEAVEMAADRAVLRRRSEPRFALDRASVRSVDADSGHLHITRTPISKANVCPYYGWEIPGHEELGLESDRTYRLYRHPDELAKAADAWVGNKPLLIVHKAVHADDHPHDDTVGNAGDVEWSPPYLTAALDVWTRDGIEGIQSGERQELSPGYAYKPDMTPGTTPDGERYDGVMRKIRFNHLALVPEGRTGRDVYVHDAAPTHRPKLKDMLMAGKAAPTRSAAVASSALSGALHGALLTYARPRLAADAKFDVRALLKGVTVKNAKGKAPAVARAFDAALKGKLAKDAEVDQADVQAIVEQVGEMIAENSDDIAAAVEPEIAAEDEDDADLRAMLKAKGYTDEEIDAICKKEAVPSGVGATAEDVEKAKTEAVKGMDAKIATAVRDAKKGMVEQTAMDSAITAAVDGAVTAERQRNRDIREAEAHVAGSPVGKLAGAFDSAPDVFRAGLSALGVKDADKLHDSALKAVFDAHAGLKAAQTKAPTATLAADSATSGKSFAEMFPGSARFTG